METVIGLITPAIKDAVLKSFIDKSETFALDITEESPEYGISRHQLRLIVEQFEEKRLIKAEWVSKYALLITPTCNAHDFASHGGFTVQEEILKANIEKLGLELDILAKELEPKFTEKIKTITDIGRNILSAYNFMV